MRRILCWLLDHRWRFWMSGPGGGLVPVDRCLRCGCLRPRGANPLIIRR